MHGGHFLTSFSDGDVYTPLERGPRINRQNPLILGLISGLSLQDSYRGNAVFVRSPSNHGLGVAGAEPEALRPGLKVIGHELLSFKTIAMRIPQ